MRAAEASSKEAGGPMPNNSTSSCLICTHHYLCNQEHKRYKRGLCESDAVCVKQLLLSCGMKNAVAPFFSEVAIQEQGWSPHLSQNALNTLDHHAEVVFRACEILLETSASFG